MKYIIAALIAVTLAGCSPYSNMMEKVPIASFDRFVYHRAGNATSMDVTVLNATKVGNMFAAESIEIKGDYGPFVNFNIILEGYEREIEDVPKN